MLKKYEEKDNDRDNYIELAEKNKVNFLQSWEWGEVKKPKWKPVRISIDSFPIQILLRDLPFGGSFGYLPRCFDEQSLTEKILNKLKVFCEDELGLTHLIIEPNIIQNKQNLKFNKIILNSGFKQSGRTIQPNYTNIIDLTSGYEEVFSNFKSTYRRNIRKAKKLSCTHEVYDSGKEALDKFYKIMEKIMNRTKYVTHGKGYFEKVWRMLSEGKKARIYIVKRKKEDLGALLIAFDTKGAYELYGGINDAGRDNRAGFLLRDVTLQDSIFLEKEFYDQWGVAAFSVKGYSEHSELIGVSRFKEGFGGRNIKFFSQYVCVFRRFGYFAYRTGLFINKIKIKIKKNL